MMDYLILTGINLIGAILLLISLYLVYHRGIAIRLGVFVIICAVAADYASFFWGRGEITLERSIIALASALVIIIPTAIILFKRIITPVRVLTAYLDRIARGDIPPKITQDYKDEFNESKNNLNALIDAMNDITQLAEKMADGNLTIEVKERSERDTLMQALNAMIQRLSEVVIQVKSVANNVAISSEEMSSGAERMSQGAAEQAAATEQASSSMEEMAANIKQNADNALQTKKIATQSAQYAEESGKVVAETVIAMQKIAKKIAVIQEIADQTRLLSLNATIEAARAQEHGKAFSVVASEVRKLADTTKTAAEDIKEVSSSSVSIAERAGEILMELVPNIQKTAELIQEISAASNEQSSGSEQINRAIQQLDQVTQQNASMAEEVASTAEELENQAEQLWSAIEFFKIDNITLKVMENSEDKAKTVSGEYPGGKITGKRTYNVARKGSTNRGKKSSGYKINMNLAEKEEFEDEQDSEFERY